MAEMATGPGQGRWIQHDQVESFPPARQVAKIVENVGVNELDPVFQAVGGQVGLGDGERGTGRIHRDDPGRSGVRRRQSKRAGIATKIQTGPPGGMVPQPAPVVPLIQVEPGFLPFFPGDRERQSGFREGQRIPHVPPDRPNAFGKFFRHAGGAPALFDDSFQRERVQRFPEQVPPTFHAQREDLHHGDLLIHVDDQARQAVRLGVHPPKGAHAGRVPEPFPAPVPSGSEAFGEKPGVDVLFPGGHHPKPDPAVRMVKRQSDEIPVGFLRQRDDIPGGEAGGRRGR